VTNRTLARVGLQVPVIWWDLWASPIVDECLKASNWCVLRGNVPVAQLPESVELMLAVDADELLSRRTSIITQRLAEIGRPRCRGVIVENLSPDQLKSGRVFHRLTQSRDQGLTQLLILEAEDALAAEWMVEHTPAHVVSVRYTIDDQAIRYRVIDAARDAEMALIARGDLRLCIGEPAIAAVRCPIPQTPEELWEILSTVDRPDPAFSETAWKEYQTTHSPPPKLKSAHPPE